MRGDLRVLTFNIMVSIDETQPSLDVEPAHQPEDMAAHPPYVLKSSVLKQLIAIPEFDIGKTLRILVFQREEEQALFGMCISHTSW